MKVNFYESVEDKRLKFAVIAAKAEDKWVFCKHKERDTYEIPGGHREQGEIQFSIEPVCVYSVIGKNRVNETGEELYGMLYYAEIMEFSRELHSEMERIQLFDQLPQVWTYPEIQPLLIAEIQRRVQKGILDEHRNQN